MHGTEKFVEEQNLGEVFLDPRRIYNSDETNFQLQPKTGKVLGPKGWGNVYDIKNSSTEILRVLGTFSVAGGTVPGMFVYPYMKPPLMGLGRSETRWMRQDTFYEYIANVFFQYLDENEVPITFSEVSKNSKIQFCSTSMATPTFTTLQYVTAQPKIRHTTKISIFRFQRNLVDTEFLYHVQFSVCWYLTPFRRNRRPTRQTNPNSWNQNVEKTAVEIERLIFTHQVRISLATAFRWAFSWHLKFISSRRMSHLSSCQKKWDKTLTVYMCN